MLADCLLLRCRLRSADGLAPAWRAWCAAAALPLRPMRVAWARGQAYAYAELAQPASVSAVQLEVLAAAWQAAVPAAAEIDVARLARVLDQPGHSHTATPQAHYVVEADFEPGWEDELARWYAQEHLPLLAAVPGCVRAMRLRNLDSGPASLACYDLVDAGVPQSPPWLAVRATPWSDIARPHFVNARRTVLGVLDAP